MRVSQRLLSLALAAGILLAACSPATERPPSPTPHFAPTTTPTPVPPPLDLSGLKSYLTGQTSALRAATATLKAAGEQYYQLAAQSNFDYAVLWQNRAGEATKLITAARTAWTQASPLYAQARGLVAGTPSLAAFDGLLASGADEAPYDLTLADGRVLARPGNLFGVTESALWGTWPAFTAPQAADWDRDGAVEFGETLPDAYVLQAATATLDQAANDLHTAAGAWTPTPSDAFAALVTGLPRLELYFDQWKNSRFVAGDAATQRDHNVILRLADLNDLLNSLQVVHTGLSPLIQRVNAAQDADIGQGLADLRAAVAEALQQAQGGRVYTPEEIDLLGADTQSRANAIAGLVTQAAALLNIDLNS